MPIVAAPLTAPVPQSGKVRLEVVRKEALADGVCRLALSAPGGTRLPDWTPGSHIDLTFAGLTRQYSLCGDRWDSSTYEVAVLREPLSRGGSAYVHERLREGDLVDLGGPRNNFALVPADHYLFIAGGIGVTPILPMLEQAERLGTPWRLLYGGRTRASMAFADRLARWGDRVELCPQDERGLLDLSVIARQPPGAKVYCCGPAPLLDAVRAACADLPAGRLRLERFAAGTLPPPLRGTPFTLELARSGRTVRVDPDTSVLDAVAAAGVPILSSCRQGICGTCETGVISGTPDHRDSLLDDAERERGDCFYPCVSRSASDRLVIDA
ncbi:PDR/VanB family oxidoreductase [Xylanimonas ulmi]|uniref:Ferredoxin-NADP reductase n=1 Tax=Xylanimonas ulmi TaxID=228973 RepID=A0A4V2EYB0_9MICO|nr:PDR/VanB family oxidoreductase [Xylanibacterium ulmi]RZS62360.1 ferredoxin-NADP reductase [Xylanibacterium ulmi]